MNFGKQRHRSRRLSVNVIAAEKWRMNRRVTQPNILLKEEGSEEDSINNADIDDMNWDEEFITSRVSASKSDQDLTVQLSRKQTLILATLLPDQILLMESFDSLDQKRIVGVLLMADVSGYTALSEKYCSTGKGGTYRLTVTLNTYLGSLIEIIYSHGGDVIKFAGDAFLALWKTEKGEFIGHTIHSVITCALIIQNCFASYETDVKVNLKVKLAISAGNLIFAPIGSGIDMSYIICGLPVCEAKKAESLCGSGEVKLTPTAWGHCYSRNYDHIIDAEGHVTVRAILYDPREKDVSKPFGGLGSVRQSKKPFTAIENLPDSYWDSPNNFSVVEENKSRELLSMRKSILHADSENIGSQIRKFMIRPVLTQIDAHQPLEYLTEMRQVSVLFLTFKPRVCPYPQLVTIVNNAYQITCEIVYKSMGCVNKIILFDKDIMILVIFGLRGFKHESEAQETLKCANSIKKSVSVLDGVTDLSIGVTTGAVYCGVVGHPLRREFTIIGNTVNKAARLMCNFRNKITCDESTFVKSKMSANGFTLQPRTTLKGIGDSGNIYEYSEDIRVKEMYDIKMIPPLLNRNDEIEYYLKWLKEYKKPFRDFDALLLIGESRVGKTSLLKWMAREATNRNFRVCNVHLTSIHSATPYLALCQIMDQILELTEPIIGFMREERIVKILQNYDEDLCYLNKILTVRFAYQEASTGITEEIRLEKAKIMFNKIIQAIADTHILIFDDLHSLDPLSWEFISLFLNSKKLFSVFSVTRGKFTQGNTWLYSVFMNSNIRKIVVGPLATSWIAPLACQILNVNAVSSDLCKALQSKCKGIPGLIETFILHLFSSGALDLKKIKESDLEEWKDEGLQLPDPALLRPQALDAIKQQSLDRLLEEDADGSITICIVTEKEELKTNLNVQNVDAMIMIQIDSLTPYQQLLLKIASVVGDTVSRELLENIMYENDEIITAKAVKRLFAMRILTCANITNKNKFRSTARSIVEFGNTSQHSEALTCECPFEHDASDNENLPKYAFCKIMKFRSNSLRNTCYELLPLNQKKEFHSRIVNFFEENPQKCTHCNGAFMVLASVNSVNLLQQYVKFQGDSFDDLPSSSEMTDSDLELQDIRTSQSEKVSTDNGFNENTRKSKSDNQSWPPSRRVKRFHISSDSEDSSNNFNSILKNKYKKHPHFKNVTMSETLRKKIPYLSPNTTNITSDPDNDKNMYNQLRDVLKAEDNNDWKALGADDTDDIVSSENTGRLLDTYIIQLESGQSQTDMTKCTCSELHIIIHERLIYHALNAELYYKYIDFLVKYSYLNIIASNPDNSIAKLKEAELNCLKTHVEHLTNFEIRRFLGKIYTLRAAAHLLNKNHSLAKADLVNAARVYGIKLNLSSRLFVIKRIKDSIGKRRYPAQYALLHSDSVYFYNTATLYYITDEDDDFARISALRSLALVQKVDCEYIDLFDALSNAIQVELDRNAPELTAEVDRKACAIVNNLSRPVKCEELYALGKLLLATFQARIARGQITSAIRAGYKSIATSVFLQANSITIEIVPDLFYVLMTQRRFREAIELAQKIFTLGSKQPGLECETWYYALCIDMILDAGFQLESPIEINHFAEYALSNNISREGGAQRRLILGLWTYWLRADVEKRAKRFETEALKWANQSGSDGSLTTLLSSMRLAEGMLESLALKVDDLKKVVDLMELRSLADRELTRLEVDARTCKCTYPRWLLLRAHSYNLSGRKWHAKNGFTQAIEEARRRGNYLEEASALAAISKQYKGTWVQCARSGKFLPWHEGAEMAKTSQWTDMLYKIMSSRLETKR